jgi:hypothetical protein
MSRVEWQKHGGIPEGYKLYGGLEPSHVGHVAQLFWETDSSGG